MSVLGIIFALLFAPFGGLFGDVEGVFVGLFLGYVFGAVIQLNSKLNKLSTELSKLDGLYRSLKRADVEQDVAAPTPAPVTQHPEASVLTPAEESAVQIDTPPDTPKAETKPISSPVTLTRTHAHTQAPRPASSRPQIETTIDKLIAKIYGFFTDGNVVAKIGVLIVFVGVGAWIKYAYQHDMLPVELRMAFFALLAIVMLVFGWRLRTGKRIYALLLQGGGVGVMYLTVFGAAKLYGMLPVGFAFAVMVALVLLSAILAVLQDAKYLALYGAAGGFLAPVLASTGGGSHVMLFSYYALLNLGIVSIAWYRSWRELNLLGFVFTFIIGSLWGAKYYKPEFFPSVEPFLILFFIFFVIIAVLFAYRQPPKLKGYVDSTLVFGTPIISFALQAALVKNFEYGLAFSALGMSAFYVLLASTLWRRGPPGMRLITEAFLAMGVVFGSLAIPLALDGRWTAAAWAMEGAAIVWIGVRQSRLLARLFGLVLQIGAGYFFLADFSTPTSSMPIFNGICLGGLTIAFAGLFCSYYLYKHHEVLRTFERSLHVPLLVWGLAWWVGSGLHEIDRFVIGHHRELNVSMLFISVSVLLAHWLQGKLSWSMLRYPILGQIYVMILLALLSFLSGSSHPFAHLGFVAWPLAFAVQYLILYRYREAAAERVLQWQHMLSFWLLLGILSWQASWLVDINVQGGAAWRDVMYAFTPAVIMFWLFTLGKRIRWPIKQHYAWYAGTAAMPVMVILTLIAIGFGLLHEGNPWPVRYIPLVNPIDLAVGFLLFLILLWRKKLVETEHVILASMPPAVINYGIAAIGFLWINGMVARTIHHWLGVRYELDYLLRSVEFRGTTSVVWTIVALTAMVIASRRGHRQLWFVGLALFIIVAAKLFLFDISSSDAMAMSISIIVVGILAVVFGYYLSPLPPRKEEQAQ